MGADSFIKFNQWKKYNKILNKLSIIIINRPEFSIKSLNSIAAKKLEKYKSFNLISKDKQHRWYFLNTKGMNVSSSKIKKTINAS
jgi:nicotinic acid mononucleotide adenylyltransferase